MNVIEQIQANVCKAMNGPMHGRPGTYKVLGTGTGIILNLIPNANTRRGVWDTGADTIDFNIFSGIIGADELAATPLEQGRGNVGDTWVFDDTPSKTWHVKQLAASATDMGPYFDIVLADYSGPVGGV